MRYANRNHRKLNSSLVDTFLRYHDDAENYRNQEINYDELYDRLSKYAKPGENPEDMNVDELFVRATPAEQASMVRLIDPSNWNDDFDEELNSSCNKRRYNSARKPLRANSNRQRNVNASKRRLNCGESYGWTVPSNDAVKAYEFACDYFGKENLDDMIVSCLGNEKLSDCLAFIFRMEDFDEWIRYQNGELE